MGSTCCKSPYYSPKLPTLGKFSINCPIQLCSDSQSAKEELPARARKFSSSDISGPLPLGTVITPPRRPPRKKKRRISRSRSLSDQLSFNTLTPLQERSKSVVDLRCERLECGTSVATLEIPKVHLSPLVVPVIFATENNTTNKLGSETTIKLSPPNDEIPPGNEEDHSSSPSQIQELISQNKRTFLATLLEENNNLRSTDMKDNNNSTSRKSSITESLREFESSLYEMLQENATAEDELSEHSLSLHQVAAR